MVLTQLSGFQKDCLRKGIPFVTYQLPDTDHPITITSNSLPKILDEHLAIVPEKEGFIFAPFNKSYPSIWFDADHIYHGNDVYVKDLPDSVIPFTSNHSLPSEISKEQYLKQVESILDSIREGVISKAVLSRIIKIPFEKVLEAPALFNRLAAKFSNAFVYMLSFPEIGCWIGASPELLLSAESSNQLHSEKELLSVKTMALAGTRHTGSSGNWGYKEIDEHNWVSKYIENVLKEVGCTSIEKSKLYTSQAGNVEHLRTDFNAKINTDKLFNVIDSLHPTPAVCGWPATEALNLILSVEEHDRSFYAGYLGPVNINHKTSMYVNLRCMQITNDEAVLYAGGGITAGSYAEAEWEETTIKSRTLLTEIEKIRT